MRGKMNKRQIENKTRERDRQKERKQRNENEKNYFAVHS